MKAFPDESRMERSKDGSEPIRGGSIGLNRILGFFVENMHDKKPRFTTILVSAFTIFRNVLNSKLDTPMKELEDGFVKDVEYLLEYFDIYIGLTRPKYDDSNRKALLIVYFPEYNNIPKEYLKETKDFTETYALYLKFLARNKDKDQVMRQTENVICAWIGTEGSSFPHQAVARKFKSLSMVMNTLGVSGDGVALISHIDVDFYILQRIPNTVIMQSHTGRIKTRGDLRYRLDKEGRIPFNSTTHIVFGDGSMIKPMVTPKIRKRLLQLAQTNKWHLKTQSEIASIIAKEADIPVKALQKIDFS